MRCTLSSLVFIFVLVPYAANAQIPQFSLTSNGWMPNIITAYPQGQSGSPPVPYSNMLAYPYFFAEKNSLPDEILLNYTFPAGEFGVVTNYDEQSVVDVDGMINVSAPSSTEDEYSIGFTSFVTWVIYNPLDPTSTDDATFDMVLDFGGLSLEDTTINYDFEMTIDDPSHLPVQGRLERRPEGLFLTGLEDYGVDDFELSASEVDPNSFSMGARVPFTVPLNTKITLRTGLSASFPRVDLGQSSQALTGYTVSLEGKTIE